MFSSETKPVIWVSAVTKRIKEKSARLSLNAQLSQPAGRSERWLLGMDETHNGRKKSGRAVDAQIDICIITLDRMTNVKGVNHNVKPVNQILSVFHPIVWVFLIRNFCFS